ncbi:hypothetical protein A3J90_03040 [candidate division WOR-1 bacterium RIFOXYC2_FULL_37_10]|uniref:SLH domain-containing protein n=1 Tax=candidate division WOR-1 bacterium RIFOXYB2_FULL_37_13 TaxID=1802579 RepID=A0A1F4SVF5_UNCSA|nr:MAG: hypothetical protein A2246_03160 [candidate division WOR-1 bacterium RIFOXYA2_FULL_37_7]OGC24424.1 MAG: hypothetical protein A2310_08450 [candidate division WOR-1 bacterium RIFOXYB2_FULL_37_13]OGC37443.1 MAG: hypothetical protein A3J90_03040 [candidate division WOR-1 bacterium RIFOXYC2_FULL_37_10]
MKKKTLLLLISFIFFLAAVSHAILFELSNIKDTLITYQDILEIKEKAGNTTKIRVNNVLLNLKNNLLHCAFILHPGKNLINIQDIGQFRVLRLISFPDLSNLYNGRFHWAKKEIEALATLGILEGFPDGNYYMNDSATRGEFATWLCKAQGLMTDNPKEDPFKDVPKEHWRSRYIKAVADKGYMEADTTGSFGIDINISRAEAAVTCLKAEEPSINEVVSIDFFEDVPLIHPLFKQLKIAKALGLIKGISLNSPLFEPDRDITRAETAILLSRLKRVASLKKELYDFQTEYTDDDFAKINIPPEILSAKASPESITINTPSAITINAMTRNRDGLEKILYVKSDLSSLNNFADVQMYDDGTNGDTLKGDGNYTIKFLASAEATGEKNINIIAGDNLGWKDYKNIKVLVVE